MEPSALFYKLGSFLFIAVGMMHLYVHFTELNTEAVRKILAGVDRIPIMNKRADVGKLWTGFSFIFGILLVSTGIMSLLALYEISESNQPSFSFCLINIIILSASIYSGKLYFGKLQIYAGLIGLVLFGMSVVLNV